MHVYTNLSKTKSRTKCLKSVTLGIKAEDSYKFDTLAKPIVTIDKIVHENTVNKQGRVKWDSSKHYTGTVQPKPTQLESME